HRARASLPTRRSSDLDTPNGPRFTRNGNFSRQADGTITTADGMPVRGVDGPLRIDSSEPLTIEDDGTVRAGLQHVGRVAVVDFEDRKSTRLNSSHVKI